MLRILAEAARFAAITAFTVMMVVAIIAVGERH